VFVSGSGVAALTAVGAGVALEVRVSVAAGARLAVLVEEDSMPTAKVLSHAGRDNTARITKSLSNFIGPPE
jgi:hypothetical protein